MMTSKKWKTNSKINEEDKLKKNGRRPKKNGYDIKKIARRTTGAKC
jgi:hypothetical protein